jgi:hypothetical protein
MDIDMIKELKDKVPSDSIKILIIQEGNEVVCQFVNKILSLRKFKSVKKIENGLLKIVKGVSTDGQPCSFIIYDCTQNDQIIPNDIKSFLANQSKEKNIFCYYSTSEELLENKSKLKGIVEQACTLDIFSKIIVLYHELSKDLTKIEQEYQICSQKIYNASISDVAAFNQMVFNNVDVKSNLFYFHCL